MVNKNKENYETARQYTAQLILGVLTEKFTVKDALVHFPHNCNDSSIKAAWHALMHFEADEDIYRKDKDFYDVQFDFLESLYNILKDGKELPPNIITEYNKYHNGVVTTLYEKKEQFWADLKRNINLSE